MFRRLTTTQQHTHRACSSFFRYYSTARTAQHGIGTAQHLDSARPHAHTAPVLDQSSPTQNMRRLLHATPIHRLLSPKRPIALGPAVSVDAHASVGSATSPLDHVFLLAVDPVETLRLPELALQALRACVDRVGIRLFSSEFAYLLCTMCLVLSLCSLTSPTRL